MKIPSHGSPDIRQLNRARSTSSSGRWIWGSCAHVLCAPSPKSSMIRSAISAAGGPMSTRIAGSSAAGSSRSANWLSSRLARMKWSWRAASRAAIVSFDPARKTNIRPEPRRLIRSRYERLRAEQVMSPFSPASRRSSIQSATFASQGQRSASVSGCQIGRASCRERV